MNHLMVGFLREREGFETRCLESQSKRRMRRRIRVFLNFHLLFFFAFIFYYPTCACVLICKMVNNSVSP